MLEATCEKNVIQAAGVEVDGAINTSDEISSSEGIVLLDEDKAIYLTGGAKVLEAQCTGGNVKVDGENVSGATKLCKGLGASEGAVLITKDKKIYLTNTQLDLEQALTTLISAFTALDALPTISGALASFTAQLNTLKGQLK